MSMRKALLYASIALCPVAMPAAAQVYVSPPRVTINLPMPPPPPHIEVVPGPRSGYVWAPGYWGWQGERHVWVPGRHIEARGGHHWVADSWQAREGRHHFAPGRWEQEDKGRGNGKGWAKGHK